MTSLIIITLALIYAILFYTISTGARRSLDYGPVVSTMLGLFLPFTTVLEIVLQIFIKLLSFSYTKLLQLILILCGTDLKEFNERMVLAIISEGRK